MDKLPEKAEEILKKHGIEWREHENWPNGGFYGIKKFPTGTHEVEDRLIASILAEELKLFIMHRHRDNMWEVSELREFFIEVSNKDRTIAILEAVRNICE